MLVKTFADWALNARGYSEITVHNYIRTLRGFDIFLRSRGVTVEECENITLALIEEYIVEKRKQGISMRTCNNYIAGIRFFLKFCKVMDRGVIDYKRVLFGKEKRKEIGFLTPEECGKIISYLENNDTLNPLVRARNLVMCKLLLETGLRVSELSHIKMDQIKEELQVVGKGGVLRVVYLFPSHITLINTYEYLRTMRADIESERLCISLSRNSMGARLSRNAIARIVSDLAKKVGIEKKVHPHLFRHTFATNLLRKGANVYHIQRLLGHKHITTTQLYLDATNNDLRDAQKLILDDDDESLVCSPILKG